MTLTKHKANLIGPGLSQCVNYTVTTRASLLHTKAGPFNTNIIFYDSFVFSLFIYFIYYMLFTLQKIIHQFILGMKVID